MSRLLGLGATGNDVKELQQALNFQLASGKESLTVDGKFGPATRRAVLAFQRRAGLAADGIVGERTRGKLFTTFTTTITLDPCPPVAKTPKPPVPSASKPVPTPSGPSAPSGGSSGGSSSGESTFPPAPTGRRAWDNLQIQLGPQQTFRPWYSTPDPSNPGRPDPYLSATLQISGTYRWFNRDSAGNWTREGAHLEIVPGLTFAYNRPYSLPYRGGSLSPWNVQGSVTFNYADLFAYSRYHLYPFAQITAQAGNGSLTTGAGIGGQFSVDLISDRLALFVQGTAAANFDLISHQVQTGGSLLGGLTLTLYPRSKKSASKK